MKVVAIIPARYKSTRFPGKPLAQILGKPMLWWVYQQTIQVEELSDVFVATDDEQIRQACQELSIPAIMTSSLHPTGSDRVAEAAQYVEGDVFINVQGDEPLIDPEMIRQTIRIFEDPSVSFGTLKKLITDIDEINNMSTVKVVTDTHGDALYFSRSPIPSNLKEKHKENVYRHVGIYGYTRSFLEAFSKLPQNALEIGEGIEPLRAMYHGYKIRVHETKYASIGVDEPQHIAEVERILKERRADL